MVPSLRGAQAARASRCFSLPSEAEQPVSPQGMSCSLTPTPPRRISHKPVKEEGFSAQGLGTGGGLDEGPQGPGLCKVSGQTAWLLPPQQMSRGRQFREQAAPSWKENWQREPGCILGLWSAEGCSAQGFGWERNPAVLREPEAASSVRGRTAIL